FFQAEDGIRDLTVTGVQTCALPILQDELLTFIKTSIPADIEFVVALLRAYGGSVPILGICKEIVRVAPERSSVWNELAAALETRSEERRVGKECRCRWLPSY